jgi:ATP-binding cassette subfamily B protein
VIIFSLKKLKKILDSIKLNLKYLFILSFLLAFFVSVLEGVFVGLIFPLIGSFVDPDKFLNINFIKVILNFLNLTDLAIIKNLILISIFINIILIAVFKIILLKLNAFLYYRINSKVSSDLYLNLLSLNLEFYKQNNSSYLVSTIVAKSQSVGESIFFFLNIGKSILLLVVIIFTSIIISSKEVLLLFFILFLLFLFIYQILKKYLKTLGNIIANEYDKIFKNLQEGFLSINLIILHKVKKIFLKEVSESFLNLRKSQSNIIIYNQIPYILLQSLIFILGIFFLFYQSKINNFLSILPYLSVYLLAAQRIFPNLHEVFSNLSSIKSLQGSLDDTYKLFFQSNSFILDERNNKLINFNNKIEFKEVNYKHPDTKILTINNVSIKIQKDTFIAIVGDTGSGKSTLLNLIAGLLSPSSGKIVIDDTVLTKNHINNWQNYISLVPQKIFLLDDTILKNIIFSDNDDKIDYNKLNLAINASDLKDFVNNLKEGLNTIVGENGQSISGGQRQKIGIARALYRNTNILILDEATNSLDSDSEKIIFNQLKKIGKKTVFVVTHNKKNLIFCDQIIELKIA